MLLELLAVKEINKPPEIPQPKPTVTIKVEKKKETKPKKIYYTVKQGDTLTKVSKAHRTPLRRVICANPKITNPDRIDVGERLKIPRRKDKLRCAKIKSLDKIAVSDKATTKPSVNSGGFSVAPSGWYDWGWCTYGAWTLAPWVGQWADANTWDDMARAEGRIVDGTPVVGAVFVDNGGSYGHVGVVIGVGKDSVTIKEMNYQGFGVWSSRIVPTSSFVYIHP